MLQLSIYKKKFLNVLTLGWVDTKPYILDGEGRCDIFPQLWRRFLVVCLGISPLSIFSFLGFELNDTTHDVII